MNRPLFLITAYVFLAVQTGLGPLWTVKDTTPNLLLILAVFVGLSASTRVVMGGFFLLGLLLDLQPGPLAGEAIIVGPHCLGYLLGGYAVLQLRNMLFRESVFTMVVMVFAVGGFAALVEVMIYALRGLPWLAHHPLPWRATDQLLHRLLELVYTAALAIPLGFILHQTRKFWGFGGRPRGERVF